MCWKFTKLRSVRKWHIEMKWCLIAHVSLLYCFLLHVFICLFLARHIRRALFHSNSFLVFVSYKCVYVMSSQISLVCSSFPSVTRDKLLRNLLLFVSLVECNACRMFFSLLLPPCFSTWVFCQLKSKDFFSPLLLQQKGHPDPPPTGSS